MDHINYIDEPRLSLSRFRKEHPIQGFVINDNYIVALPVRSLLDSTPVAYRCFVNGFELKCKFTTLEDLQEHAGMIIPGFGRSPHVDPKVGLLNVQFKLK